MELMMTMLGLEFMGGFSKFSIKCVQFDGECNRAGPRAREVPSYKADTDING